MHRRDWLKKVGIGSVLVAQSAGLRAEPTIEATNSVYAQTVAELLDGAEVSIDPRVELHVPTFAINSAVIPIELVSNIPGTRSLHVLVDNHPFTVVAQLYTHHALMLPQLATHIKLERPAQVVALVESSLGWYKSAVAVTELNSSCEVGERG